MYTLGELMVSSDDDMRPYSLIEDSPESLGPDEVCRGRLHKAGENGYTRKSFDIVAAFLDVLGKPVADIPENYDRGELLIDSAMELETNATKGLARENSLTLRPAAVPDSSVVKIAQTFRSGTNDIDAVDFVDMFLEDEDQTSLDDLNENVRAGQFPSRRDQPELADGLWRRRLRQYLRAAAVLPHPLALRGLHLPALDPAGRHRGRPRGCRAESHQEQLHAQPAGGRDLQRRGLQSPEAQNQGHGQPHGRAQHRVRL